MECLKKRYGDETHLCLMKTRLIQLRYEFTTLNQTSEVQLIVTDNQTKLHGKTVNSLINLPLPCYSYTNFLIKLKHHELTQNLNFTQNVKMWSTTT